MKSLLAKVVGSCILTIAEMFTVLAEVEVTMNRRPLVPLDLTPIDGIVVLTPAHFLVGRPLLAIPEHIDKVSNISSLRRWNLCKRLKSDIWERWSREYLYLLHRFNKWQRPQINLQVGDIVLVKD